MNRRDRYICLSPITNEKNASFYIYPENKFYCFSSGTGGSIIDLVRVLEQLTFIDAVRHILEFKKTNNIDGISLTKLNSRPEKVYGTFNIKSYVSKLDIYVDTIIEYGEERGFLKDSYLPCRYMEPYTFLDIGGHKVTTFIEMSGAGFPHTDHFNIVCGMKIRGISDKADPKFNQRGKPGFYVIENRTSNDDPAVYIVESETSASSFGKYVKELEANCVIISFGGINSVPKCLPYKYEYLTERYLIIDYDGDEDKWEKRKNTFKHLKADALEIPAEKGVDLGSLSNNGELEKYIKV